MKSIDRDTFKGVDEPGSAVETLGIERVSPIARSHVRIFDNFTTWLACNLVMPTLATGSLAVGVFGLGLWDSIATIVVFNALGILPVAFFSTLGPKLGLRQMTISRFSFGWIGAGIMALFNVLATIGWSAVNVIVGAQLITAVSGGAFPTWIGILVITACTTLVSLYGYRYVHHYERYAWMPMALIFLVIFALAAPKATVVTAQATGIAHTAALLSFGGGVYAFSGGWAVYAADYNVKQPEDTPPQRVFWLTYLGVFIPCVLLEILGVILTTIPAFNGKSGGDLIAAVVSPLGVVGTLMLLFLALSIVANNVPIDYSLALSAQVLGGPFQRVKRAFWTLLGATTYTIVAISASSDFNQTLGEFLLLIAYWIGPWSIILILEHFMFRQGRYNVEDWNTAGRLPVGWAAGAAMLAGLLGVYLGAAQVAFVGPIARLFNPPAGIDIGFQLGMLLAGIAYAVARPIERSATGR